MTKLFINSLHDMPHRASDLSPLVSACQRSLIGAKEITDLQALKFLDNRRCTECFPNWASHNVHLHRSAA